MRRVTVPLRSVSALLLIAAVGGAPALAQSPRFTADIYPVGKLPPVETATHLRVGDPAPDFVLPAVDGSRVSLGQYRGKKNVVLSFVPAAWTPVCSAQWPGYNIAKEVFEKNDAVLLGITVDNIPTLYAWTREMCSPGESVWFPVLSDFFPHGAVAQKYGILRPEGVAERALFVIDKVGVIRYIDVHDINLRPPLEDLAHALEAVQRGDK